MLSYFKYLKSGLRRQLPDDHFNQNIRYGGLWKNLGVLYPSVLRYWRVGAISILILLLSAALAWPAPLLNRYLIDQVILAKRLNLIIPVMLMFVGLGVAVLLTDLLKNFSESRFVNAVMLDLNERLLNKVMSLPKTFFDQSRTGYLISRITTDVNGVRWFISGTAAQMFINVIKLLGGIFFLCYLEWRIAVPVLLLLPLSFVCVRFFSRRAYVMGHYSSEVNARKNSDFTEAVANLPLIKSFAREDQAISRIIGQFKKIIHMDYERQALFSFSNAASNLLPTVVKWGVWAYGAYLIIIGEWQLGSLIAFQSYLTMVFSPITQLANSLNQFEGAHASIDRLSSLLAIASEDNLDSGKIVDKLTGKIEFRNVFFSYETASPVLCDLSMTLEAGKHYVIVGANGVGKTTLVGLILRMYKPLHGEIYFDGMPISELNVRSLRRRFGYVAQSTCLQSGSILDNLRYGNEEATENEVIAAAKLTGIHDFIEKLPEKYQTQLAEAGKNLSEGQKQRIAIARALVCNPDVLILDEPTSAIDNAGEMTLFERLPAVAKNKTIITIAHRLHNIRSADQIIFLRKQQPPLFGSHQELLEDADYRELFAGMET